MIRAVIFDFDGVLANSEPLHFAAFRDVLAEEGVPFSQHDYYTAYLGYSDVDLFRTLARDRTEPWDGTRIAALTARKAARFEELERSGEVLFPGAAAAVERLYESYALAIASGAFKAEILRVLEHSHLTSRFRAIVGADDTTASKPAPDPYLLAVKLLRTAIDTPLEPHECVAVEDSVWGLQSAREAGLRTIAVTHTYQASLLGEADLVVESLSGLTRERIAALFPGQPASTDPII